MSTFSIERLLRFKLLHKEKISLIGGFVETGIRIKFCEKDIVSSRSSSGHNLSCLESSFRSLRASTGGLTLSSLALKTARDLRMESRSRSQ